MVGAPIPWYYNWDPVQMMILLVSGLITAYASMKVNSTFAKYSKVRSLSGYTGKDAANRILMINNLNEVQIKGIRGSMTDHYNPLTKEVGLSETVYGANSISAISVAAHEVGHAIQDATGYKFLRFRHAIYPLTNIASRLSIPLIFIGLLFQTMGMVTIGIYFFAFTTLFTLVTLPVEFNASSRAIKALDASGILSTEELDGAKEVLNAAALTYVAATAASLLTLLRLVLIAGRRRD